VLWLLFSYCENLLVHAVAGSAWLGQWCCAE